MRKVLKEVEAGWAGNIFLSSPLCPCLFADFCDRTTRWPLETLGSNSEDVFKAKPALSVAMRRADQTPPKSMERLFTKGSELWLRC